MNIFNKDYRKTYNNPYRHGVLIGNHIEDTYGQDLITKQEQARTSEKHFVSEKMDRYQWPVLKENHVKTQGNDLTSKFNSNFDLNIDFAQKNLEDYLKLQKSNEFELQDKNVFLPEQIKSERQIKKMNETRLQGTQGGSQGGYQGGSQGGHHGGFQTGFKESTDINNETQNMLKQYHQKDSRGLLYTKKAGLVKNLFFRHGSEPKANENNEYVSTNYLTMGKKEKTDKIYDLKYKLNEQEFRFPPKEPHDISDWGFRKYKKYDQFTKTFDITTNLEC